MADDPIIETPPVETPPVETAPEAGLELRVDPKPDDDASGEKAFLESELKTNNPGPVASLEGLKLPEGQEFNEEQFNALKQIFDDNGVHFSQDMAQRLVDFENQRVEEATEAGEQERAETLKGWEEDVRNDPEIGGDNYEQNLVAAQEAVRALASEEFVDLLEASGLGSHPEMVRLFVRLAPYVREERPTTPSTRERQSEKDRLTALYGRT